MLGSVCKRESLWGLWPLNKKALTSAQFGRRKPSMEDFTGALMTALRTGSEDPERGALGAQMKARVAELTDAKASKTRKAAAAKALASLREAYRRQLLTS